MRAKLREIREVEFEIDPSKYPEEVGSWEEALEYDAQNTDVDNLSDFHITTESELLGDPGVEPWPGAGKLPPRCPYEEPWVGKCGRAAAPSGQFCSEHSEKKCWCGMQAVRGCSTAGSFVCGQPLCVDHDCCHVAAGMTGSPGNPHSHKGREQWKRWKAGKEGEDL